MNKKVLFLDYLSFNSTIQVGSHKYARLFRENGYEVFSLSSYINLYKFFRRTADDLSTITQWQKGVQKSVEGIYYYTPFCLLPYMNFAMLDNLKVANNCLKYSFPQIKGILKDKDFVKVDIVFIHDIRLISVLKFIKPKTVIYRISDRINGFENIPKTILSLQYMVKKKSDLIFATSRNIYKETKEFSDNTFYLPNGVDENFIIKKDDTYSKPAEYKDIKKPIVVYVGAISDWFDYELYEFGIKNLQDVAFVLIGPVSGVSYRENKAMIEHCTKKYKNFYYLGEKNHAQLKEYLFYSDLGIIPFTITQLTDEINPVKFFEYSAIGLPTLSSNMAEMHNYKEHVSLYNNKEEYVELINNLINKKECQRTGLIKFAQANTWRKRFEYMLDQIKT